MPRNVLSDRRVRWSLTVVVLAVVGWFFVHSLVHNWAQVRADHLGFDPAWVLATVLFAASVPLTGVLCGRMLTRMTGVRVSLAEAVALQCASWLLKYIPGQVGSVVNKVVWGSRKGIARTAVVIAFVYENVFLQVCSILPAAVILPISLGTRTFGQHKATLLLPLIALVPLAAVLYQPVLRAAVALPARRLLKNPVPPELFLGLPAVVEYAVGFLGPRILNGIGFVLIAASVVHVGPGEWLPFGAAYVLAGAVGILAVFVPSGLGVREAVTTAVLAQYVSTPQAVIISLLARLCSTVGDVLVAVTYVLVRRLVPGETRP